MTFKKGKRWFADWCDENGKRKRKAFSDEAEATAYQVQQQQIARARKKENRALKEIEMNVDIPNFETFRAEMNADRIEDFEQFRAEMNEEILGCGHLGMKRFFALDHQAYEDGALPGKTKELLGLVASAVLRCDDCVTYHVQRCADEGWKRDEVIDALNVALIVGGSITIPHLRRAFARMREIPALKP